MTLKTRKSEIIGLLNVAQNFISTSATLPLLSNILFEADGEVLSISATDMDISVTAKCKVEKIEETGKTTIPKKIISLIKELPDEVIKIESDKNDNIKVQCKKSLYRIPGLPAEDFPDLGVEGKKLESIKIPHKTLKDIIVNVAYAALKDSSKRNLNGVFMKFEGNKLEAVATDAHRLAYYKSELKDSVKSKFEYIVPLKTINELGKLLEDSEEKEVEVNFHEKTIEFKIDNIDIVSRVIDENYPNYNQVIPKDFTMKAFINKEEMEGAIKRASTISSEKSRVVMLKLEKNKLTINAQAQDEGEAVEEIDAKYDGEPVDVSYNAVYLLDILKITEGGEIELKLISSMNPGVIKDPAKENLTYVVMPIRK
jgi:DNA polymerase III subunit beta